MGGDGAKFKMTALQLLRQGCHAMR